MQVGKLYVRLAWSMWRDWHFHRIDGRKHVPLMMHMDGQTAVFGRGGVLAFGALMLWWVRETHRVEIGR